MTKKFGYVGIESDKYQLGKVNITKVEIENYLIYRGQVLSTRKDETASWIVSDFLCGARVAPHSKGKKLYTEAEAILAAQVAIDENFFVIDEARKICLNCVIKNRVSLQLLKKIKVV